ncbi:MAG: helix-turn-helix domain-containing protein [Sarcina sp.]
MEFRKVDYFDFDEICWMNLTPVQERIYRYLLSCRNTNHDFCFPGQNLIAEKTGVNVKTVQRSIKVLEEKEFLVVEKMKAIIGNYNRYKLLIVPCQEGIYEKMKARKKDDKFDDENSDDSDKNDKGIDKNIDKDKKFEDKNSFDINDNNLNIESEFDIEADDSLFVDNEDRKVKDCNINKLLLFTRIKVITKRQKESLREFDTMTINQTIARIKSGITKMPRTATLLIDKVCDAAIGLGRFKQWQYRKYGILKPVLKSRVMAVVEEVKVIEPKVSNKYEGYEDILGWYD